MHYTLAHIYIVGVNLEVFGDAVSKYENVGWMLLNILTINVILRSFL